MQRRVPLIYNHHQYQPQHSADLLFSLVKLPQVANVAISLGYCARSIDWWSNFKASLNFQAGPAIESESDFNRTEMTNLEEQFHSETVDEQQVHNAATTESNEGELHMLSQLSC